MPDSKLATKLRRIPAVPGVYLFKSAGDEIIYIGKAKVLKDRVRSYFLPSNTDPKVAAIISKIVDIEWIITDSDVEALILESTLIKKHKPRYNIDLKDSKRYPFLKMTVNEPFPRIEVVRAIERDNAKYFGPYVDAGSMRRVLQILERVLKIRTCKTALPSPAGRRTCLNFQIGKCQGLCAGNVSGAEYAKRVNNAVLLLVGRNHALLEALEKEMKEASRNQEFERAAALRDGISAVQRVMVRQRMSFGNIEDRDVIAGASEGKDCCVAVFQIREGVVAGRHHFFMRLALGEGEGEILASFLQGYYRKERYIPCEVMVAAELPDCLTLEEWLSREADKTVRVLAPQKGEKAKLVELCRKNAQFLLNDFLIQRGRQDGGIPVPLQFLKKDLDLPLVPRLIEAYDISHTGGDETVASQVTFLNGKPRKSAYRKYIIRTVSGVDDFAALQEVIARRVRRSSEGKDPLPDLLLIDGGRGQLSSVVEVLDRAGEGSTAVAALAKRFEEIYVHGRSQPLMIPRRSPALRLLQRIRDEAHRFAVTFHRQRRGKKLLASGRPVA